MRGDTASRNIVRKITKMLNASNEELELEELEQIIDFHIPV